MFGGLFKSPKARLTEYLVEALDEFVVVDKDLIQSNLLSDTRIILSNVSLRPHVIDDKKITGITDCIEFSWKWGGDETTQFIRDVTLEVKGAKICIQQTDEPASAVCVPPSTSEDSGEKESYIQGIVQQVMDHLTLRISNVELTIQTPSNDTFTVSTTSLELSTIAKKESNGLMQKLTLTGLAAFLVHNDVQNPLLDPVNYTANVSRTSGKRFVSGAMNGLTITGVQDTTAACLHLDEAQAKVLSSVAEMFLRTIPPVHPNWQGLQEALDPNATTATLPLPALEIQLKDTSIHTSSSVFFYRMDGSIFELVGKEGIFLKNGFPLLSLEKQISWKLDLKESQVSLQGEASDIPLASVLWNEAEVKTLLRNCQELSRATSSSVKMQMEDVVLQELENHAHSSWTMDVPGSFLLSIAGKEGEFLEMRLSMPTITMNPDGSVVDMKFDRFKLGPQSSFGETALDIHPTQLVDGILRTEEAISLTIDSEEKLTDLVAFSRRLIESVTVAESNSELSLAQKRASTLPFGISAPVVNVSGPSTKIAQVKGILVLKDMNLSIVSVEASDENGLAVGFENINFRGLGDLKAFHCEVGVVNKLHLPNLLALEQPVLGIVLKKISSETLEIRIPAVQIKPLLLDSPVAPANETIQGAKTENATIDLPFVVHLYLGAVTLSPTARVRGFLKAGPTELHLEQREGNIHVEAKKVLSARLSDAKGNYIAMSVDDLHGDILIQHNGSAFVDKLTLKDILVDASASIGPMTAKICHLVLSKDLANIEGGVKVSEASILVRDRLQHFADKTFLDSNGGESGFHFDTLPIHCDKVEISVLDLDVTSATITGIKVQSNKLTVICVSLQNENGLFGSAEGIAATTGNEINIEVARVTSCRVPNLFELASPMQDLKLQYADGVVSSSVAPIRVKLLKPKQEYEQIDQTNAAFLPFPFQMKTDGVEMIFEDISGVSLNAEGLDVLILPGDGGLSLSNEGTLTFRLRGFDDHWIDMGLDAPFLAIKPTREGWKPSSLSCDVIRVGPSSVGHVTCQCSAMSMPLGSDTISINDTVSVSIGSAADLMKFYKDFVPLVHFFDRTGSPQSSIKVFLASVAAQVSAPMTQVQIDRIQLSSSQLLCGNINVRLEDKITGAAAGIQAKFSNQMQLYIDSLHTLEVSNVFALTSPTKEISVDVGDEVSVRAPAADLELLSNGVAASGSDDSVRVSLPTLDIPVRFRLGVVSIKPSPASTDKSTVKEAELYVAAGPPQECTQPSLSFVGQVESVDNKMLDAKSISVAGLVTEEHPVTVRNFVASLDEISIVAGFSDVDWAGMAGGSPEEKSIPIRMPEASLQAVSIDLAYRGALVGSATSVKVPEFNGGPSATLDDIFSHIRTRVMGAVPSFITNVEFMGEKITDSTARGIGISVMSKSVTGVAMGSVTGLVAADSIRGAISAGKQSRGGDRSDSYKFGDFTRGIGHSIGQAARSGRELRRGDSDQYQVGDISAGTANAAGEYVAENKERLGAAGGSGIGMSVGLALAGPVGLLAGAYLGAKAGGKAVGPGKGEERPAESEATTHPDTDLLGMFGQENTVSEAAKPADANLLGLSGQPMQVRGRAMPATTQPVRGVSQKAAPSPLSNVDFFANFGASKDAHPVSSNRSATPFVAQQQQLPLNNDDFFANFGASKDAHPVSSNRSATPFVAQQQQLPQSQQYGQPFQRQPGNPPGQPQQHYAHVPPTQQRQQHFPPPPHHQNSNAYAQHNQSQQFGQQAHQDQQAQPQGYRFGDLTRGAVAAGKKKSGRSEDDGYKFGDFTRGLFGK